MNLLYLKHLVATSRFSGPAEWVRHLVSRRRSKVHPELALLHVEDVMMAEKLKSHVKPGMLCLDIGAHIGSVAYQLEAVAGRGQVRLIEAVPEKANWLSKRFGGQNVSSCAIADAEGSISFHVHDKRPGFSSLTAQEGTREIKVPVRRLDDLFPNEIFQFIKIDVEGHELPVLQSGKNLLIRSRPLILFEAGPTDLDMDEKYDQLFDWFTNELAYDIYAVFELDHKKPPLDLARFRSYRTYPFLAFNYFAVPRTTEK